MTEKINVKLATKEDFQKLLELDFSNTYKKMFSISQNNNQININEVDLEKPIINASENYINEMKDYISGLDKPENFSLIGFYNSEPAGYIFSNKQKWSNGIIYNVEGVLVAKKFQNKGIAQALIIGLIQEAKKTENCRGVWVEMDTTKYAANKLLLKMGFKFAGTKFYIYSNEEPSEYSKEAMYFYYKIA